MLLHDLEENILEVGRLKFELADRRARLAHARQHLLERVVVAQAQDEAAILGGQA